MTKPLDPIEPLTATHHGPAPMPGSACQNCETMLQGSYCHVCGQHAHNPLGSFRHAVEDVFESFWHVDGRIFRTLRDLLVPGKIAREYLAGHRVRYIPPLRLYVILSLITFFIAHFATASLEGGLVAFNDGDNMFAAQPRVEDVERERDAQLVEIDKSLQEAHAAKSITAITAITTARGAVQTQAQARIEEITGKPASPDDARTGAGTSPPAQADAASPDAESELDRTANENVRLFAKDKRAFAERALTHTPTTLLVLVPLFALVLRLVYLLRPMGYLEHLVVALYSHAFLLLIALAWMSMLLLDRAMHGTFLGATAGAIFPILIPIYLLFSQKRIYGDGWLKTLLRYGVTALLYSVLATLAMAAVLIMALLLKP